MAHDTWHDAWTPYDIASYSGEPSVWLVLLGATLLTSALYAHLEVAIA